MSRLRRRGGSARQTTRTARRDAGTWFLILLFPVMFAGGGLALVIAGGQRTLDAIESPWWSRAQGTVVYLGRRSQSVDVQVVYDYYVNDQHYRSMQYSFSSSHARASADYAVGQPVTVFYDTDRPQSSVLKPGIGTSFMLPLFGAIAIVAGLAIGRFIYGQTG